MKVDSRADQPQNKLSLSSSSSPGGENSRQNTKKKSFNAEKGQPSRALRIVVAKGKYSNRLSFIISKRRNLILKSKMLSLITDGLVKESD